MIVKMLKYSFLVYHKEYDGFLERLRNLGAVHVIEKQNEVSEEIQAKYDQVKTINDTIKFLEKSLPENPKPIPSLVGSDVLTLANDLEKQNDQLQQQLATVSKEAASVAPWGEFSPDTLNGLKEQGIRVKFFSVSTSKFKSEWLEQYPIEVVADVNGLTYFIMLDIGQLGEVEIDADELRTPERPASQLNQEVEKLKAELEGINAEIAKLASEGLEALKAHRNEVLQETEYHRVVENTLAEADDKVRLLEGWIPVVKKTDLETTLDSEGLVYIEQEPAEKENIPILLKNNKFVQKFEMLGELYSLPRYGELDLTPFFAPFYMIFFGFCLGDIGYGILLSVAALAMRSRVAKEMRGTMSLVNYMGLSTIAFGFISGTFFGIDLYATGLPIYSSLAAEFKARDTDITMLLFYLALILGAIQIIFGQILKAVNETIQFGWKLSMGTYGWVILLIGMVTIALISTIQGVEMELYMNHIYAVLGVSGLLIFPLSNLKRNPLINIGAGLWSTYNMVTGLLGDLLSYIRLFALGIASAILGFVFNSLALSVSEGIPVVSIISVSYTHLTLPTKRIV